MHHGCLSGFIPNCKILLLHEKSVLEGNLFIFYSRVQNSKQLWTLVCDSSTMERDSERGETRLDVSGPWTETQNDMGCDLKHLLIYFSLTNRSYQWVNVFV